MTDIKSVRTSSGKVVQMPREQEQLHIKLVPPAADALAKTMARRASSSKTDMANRLLQIGEFFDEKLAEGYKIIIEKDGESETVHIV
ncbi:hypothetical protein [Streptomyces sp. NPDC088727]|uniref:hypothetical protein n=1 Tax=Streptomyces sp. NPDC088727 TaxID=3365875 RepID=UPI003817D8F6